MNGTLSRTVPNEKNIDQTLERLGGEDIIRRKYPELYKAVLNSRERAKASPLRDPIQVVKKELTETSYEIPFDALGFTKNDILSGMMQFNIDKAAAQTIKEKADKYCAEHELKEISAIMRDICGIASK